MPGPLPSSAGLHCKHSCRSETKAWPSQTVVAQNGGDRPASTESWTGDSKATPAGQSGMVATRGNGNVNNMLLKEEELDIYLYIYMNILSHPYYCIGSYAFKLQMNVLCRLMISMYLSLEFRMLASLQ